MKVKTISILSIIVLLTLTTISAADISISNRPQHKGIVCIYCHETKGYSIGEHEDEGGCDNCHTVAVSKVLLESVHSNVCKTCHTIPNNDEEYHNLHTGINCTKCHGSGPSTAKPTTGITDCAACHGIDFSGNSNIHLTHRSRLEDICAKCHGTRPPIDPNGIKGLKPAVPLSAGASIANQVGKIGERAYAKTVDYKQYTLLEVFKKFFS
jgi:hypothetical protein